MRVIPKNKVIFSFNAEHPCQYTVQDGETFWVETDDCYSGQITDPSIKRPDIDISIMDCSVGPIAVQGAMPGDTLCVEILAIEFGPQGGPGGPGRPDHRAGYQDHSHPGWICPLLRYHPPAPDSHGGGVRGGA